ncbi:MAG: hypothetical protein ABWY29_12440 [Blastococcus sp.]
MTQTVDPPVVAEAPADTHAGSDATTSVWRWTGSRSALAAVVAMIVAAIGLRTWLVSERWLYTDDLLTGTRAWEMDLLSRAYLLDDQGGHLVPGPLLTSGLLTRLAPLEWWPLATVLIAAQIAAALAVLRLLRVLVGDRPALLVPLAVFLFSPLTLGAVGWWSAATLTLPVQIGLPLICADALLLARTGRRRYAVTGSLALLVTLAFQERAIVVPLLAFGLVAVLLHAQGEMFPARVAWRRARALWVGLLLVLALWAWAFLSFATTETAGSATVGQAMALTRSLLWNLLPALIGGPWSWSDAPPGTPLSEGPSWMFVAACVGLGLLVAWTCWRRKSAVALWAVAAAFVVANQAPVGLGRGSTGFADVLPLTFRYFTAEAVVTALVVAVLLVLPRRSPAAEGALHGLRQAAAPLLAHLRNTTVARRSSALLVPLLTVAFVASSVVSTVEFERSWSGDPSKDYLTTAREALAAAGPSPLLDLPVPEDIMWSLAAPYNKASRIFGPLTDRPDFADATHDLRVLDETGELRPARVAPSLAVQQGPTDCGWRIPATGSADVPLDAPLFHWVWTAELDYTAARDGHATVRMGVGEPVEVPVLRGSHTVYVHLVGDGGALTVTGETRGLDLCVGSGVVGNVVIS